MISLTKRRDCLLFGVVSDDVLRLVDFLDKIFDGYSREVRR